LVNRPIVIVGAGAAGLAASIFAAGGGPPIVVVERTTDGGRKILISGGGRCNILPAAIQPERFVSDSPAHLLRGLLRSWPIEAQIEFFERDAGIPLAFERESSKWFPASNRARDVRDGLVALAARRGVQFRFGTTVTALSPAVHGWDVETSAGPIEAAGVILASGGLSVPATGSDGIGLGIARELGHEMQSTYPALTPLTAESGRHAHLSGLSLDERLRAKHLKKTIETRGGFLFTHRGYSGPAVLDASHVAVRSRMRGAPAVIRVQWCAMDAAEWDELLTRSAGAVSNVVARHLPQRLAEALVTDAGIPAERSMTELRRAERVALIDVLTACPLPWTGDEGFKKAEVTGGGVGLGEIDPNTMESRRHPGLFLCGEILDAFGPIGGHNFAWAWMTGRAAGRAARAPGE
jgi:predicted Rossmann fold flavoprotein